AISKSPSVVLVDPVRARRAESVVLASFVLLSTAGCTFFAQKTTLKPYDPSDGVGTQIGNVKVLNALLLSSDGVHASLLVNVANDSDNGVSVKFQYEGTGSDGTAAKINANVFVNAGAVTSFGGQDERRLILNGIATRPGALFPIFVQYGDVTGKLLLVPVLDGTLSQYKDLLPVVPTETPTVTPTATTAPTPSPTPTK
ncbi:MAG: hypothetical protein ACYCZY_05875, partial [Lacisediminihabitans sp.]